MPAVTTQPVATPPAFWCTCGRGRTFDDIGELPPVGMEHLCQRCFTFWRLVSYSVDAFTGIKSWLWAELPARKASPVAPLSTLARHALGVEAALAGLGYTWHARGEA